ncbi:hypothetical protein VTL71DRAFT_13316 [Oculimacula yallundae]|uniref:Uncharacterized protein n=1 Tax=Oculimacula yallundae TaxID=86028 RepID=A0ABR4CK45_9HELO
MSSHRGTKRKVEEFSIIILDDDIPARRRSIDPAAQWRLDISRKSYKHLLPNPDTGIDFLYSDSLSTVLKETSVRVAAEYGITEEEALEEFRRFMAIKAFTSDEKAKKVSPTALSKQAIFLASDIQPNFRSSCTDGRVKWTSFGMQLSSILSSTQICSAN